MNNFGIAIMHLTRFFTTGSHQEEKMGFLVWLIAAAIESAIIALIVAAIAHAYDKKKNDFGDWFGGTFVVVGIIEIILALSTCS